MLLGLPWLLLSVLVYNAIVFTTATPLDAAIARIPLISGAVWTLRLDDLIVAGTLCLLLIEILKVTRAGGNSLVEHTLSTMVLIVCVIEFLVVREAGTSVFLFIVLVALVNVVAGLSFTIRAVRRESALGPGPDAG